MNVNCNDNTMVFSGNNGGRGRAVRAWLLIGVCALLGAVLVGCPDSGTENTDPSVSITTTSPAMLTENSLNRAVLTLTLKNATYTDPLPADVVTLTTTPSIAGLSVGSVARRSATEAVVMLVKDSVDFTVDTDLTVTVLAAAHSGNGNLTAPAVSIAAVAIPAPVVRLSTPAANTITEAGTDSAGNTATGSTTLTVNLGGAAPSALNVLVDITQMTPAATPANVTYGLDYGVAISGDQMGFSFDSTTTPSTLMTRRVEVPFAAGVMSRTLTITAAEDVDGLSEVLSIRLVADNSYRITSENTNVAAAARTLTMTDNEGVLTVDQSLTTFTEGAIFATFLSVTSLLPMDTRVYFQIDSETIQANEIASTDVRDVNGDLTSSGVQFAMVGIPLVFLADDSCDSSDNCQTAFVFQVVADADSDDETLTITLLDGNGYTLPTTSVFTFEISEP